MRAFAEGGVHLGRGSFSDNYNSWSIRPQILFWNIFLLFISYRLFIAYSEPGQTSKMEIFAKIINLFHSLITFAKSSILWVLNAPLASLTYFFILYFIVSLCNIDKYFTCFSYFTSFSFFTSLKASGKSCHIALGTVLHN